MEGDTERRQCSVSSQYLRLKAETLKLRVGINQESVKNYLKRALLATFFLVYFFSAAYAENEVPEGYDENTEVTVKGTLKVVLRGMRGPVIIILKSGNKDYKVITAPLWYLAQEGIELAAGTAYEVTGSKYIARDGNHYIIAGRLKNLSTGKISSLRDSSCMPLWKGHRMRRGLN
jgi:hypothetical protein